MNIENNIKLNIVEKTIGGNDIIINIPKFEKELILVWNRSEQNFVLTVKPGGKLILKESEQ